MLSHGAGLPNWRTADLPLMAHLPLGGRLRWQAALMLEGPDMVSSKFAMLLLAASLGACSMPQPGAGEDGPSAAVRVELPSRPGIMQPVLFTAAIAPVASVILFPGGDGVLSGLGNNFLVRVSGQVAASGLNVALADAPSDQGAGMGTPFRSGEAQAKDVAAIVAFLRSKSPVPVWVVGTSRGSVSAANAAERLGLSQIAGLVLTSAVWADGMEAIPLDRIAVPTLVVHNRSDGCAGSPFDGATSAVPRLSQAPAKDLIAVSGGSGLGAPCRATSPHGYYGIEGAVVPPMVAWIKAHSAR